jgi:RNA polymerase sigma-70 factor, ECF subfamily
MSDLEAAREEAQRRYPGLEVAAPEFSAYVAERAGAASADVGKVELVDLYLACACALGVEGGVDRFLGEYGADIATVGARMRLPKDVQDELRQRLCERLFVGTDGQQPKIVQYTGQGQLRAWVRAVATRLALDLVRRGSRHKATEEEPDDVVVARIADSPDVRFEKESHRAHLRAALKHSFSELDAREKNLLRYAFVDGLGIDELAAIYRVHRATAARWLVAARDDLAKRVRAHLKRELGLDEAACMSVVRDGFSQVDLTLRTMSER